MKNTIKNIALMLLFISTTAGCDNTVKSEDYVGKKYSADIKTQQLYNGHYYFEFNFNKDSECTFYSNLYDQKQNQFAFYSDDIKDYTYKYYVDKTQLVLVKTGINGADTMRLEISGNNLVWNHEGYPQYVELQPITLTKN